MVRAPKGFIDQVLWPEFVELDRALQAYLHQATLQSSAKKAMPTPAKRRTLHHSSDKSLPNLAEMYNPCIQGWINYYGNFYRMQLRSTLKRIDLYVIRWARRKFKRLRRKTKGARDWFDRLRRQNPTLFAHWQLCHGGGRTSGAV
jgi:RNA-directed DNA polymerase